MRKNRKYLCIMLALLLMFNAIIPVGAEEATNPSITKIRPGVLPAKASSFYFYIEGSSLGTTSNSRQVEILDASQPGVNQINVIGLSGDSGSSIRVTCTTITSTGLAEKEYIIKVTIDGKSTEYTVNAVDTPVLPYMKPGRLPVNATNVEFRLEGSNFDLLTNGQYSIELYVKDESGNDIVVGNASSANMINNGSNIDVSVTFSKPEMVIKDRTVYFRIVGPTVVYYGVPLELTVVDYIIITKFNSVIFNQTANDSSNPNYEFRFYGYNLNGVSTTAEIKDSNGQVVETLVATGQARSNDEDSIVFILPKTQRTLSGQYTIKVLPNSGTYSLDVTNTSPQPVIKQLMSGYLPSGYSKFAVRLIGSNFSDNASVTGIYLYDSSNNNLLASRRINSIFQYGPTDKGLDAELTLSSNYNNNQGLKNGESYSLVVEINGIKSQPLIVNASNAPMIYRPMSWDITPSATKYYVEFKGYNLRGLAGKVTSGRLVNNKLAQPVVIGTTENVQVIDDYIDNEHLKFYFDSIDLSSMSLGQAFMFEVNAIVPLSFVTGDIGIRLNNIPYFTSYGYDNRATEYYYNAYGFNLTDSYTLILTNSADALKTYSTALPMITEDNVCFKANVSIPKNLNLPSGEYNVVIKDAAGNQLRSWTNNLTFESNSITITGIRPAIIPANEPNYYFYINGNGFGNDIDKLEVELFDPTDETPNVQENLINVTDEISWGDTIRIELNTTNPDGLQAKVYKLRVIKDGSLSAELDVNAIDTPVIVYMSPYKLPVNATSLDVHFEGGNFDLFADGDYKLELYTKASNDAETIVESMVIPAQAEHSEGYHDFTMPVSKPDLLTNGTKVYVRVTGPTTVYYGVDQEMTVTDTPIVSGLNYPRLYNTIIDASKQNYEFEFWGFNLEGKSLTADIMNSSDVVVKTLETVGVKDDQGKESAAFILPKSENLPSGEYKIRINSVTGDYRFTLQNNNLVINDFNEARAEGSIMDNMSLSYQFEFSGTNLEGRSLVAVLKDAQGVVLETLNSMGVKADNGSEHVTFGLPKSKRVLPVGAYTIGIVGNQNVYSFEVSADTNIYYDINISISHDINTNNYDGLSIKINGENTIYNAAGGGSFVIPDLVNGVYDMQIMQPKFLGKRITVVVNNADSEVNVVLSGGDLNGDNSIGIDDLVILSMGYDSETFDARADIDNDGDVDLLDLTVIAANYEMEGMKSIGVKAWGETLDPNKITSTNEILIANAVYEGLVRVHDGFVQPGMAANWVISEDGLTYTFNLRDAYWSDGVPVTAYDFQYSILRLLDPEYQSGYAYQGYYIKNGEDYYTGKLTDPSQVGVRVINEKTLQIELAAPCKYFLSILGSVSFMPVREDVVAKLGADYGSNINEMVYNGPFIPNGWDLLTRNTSYWNRKAVEIDSVKMFNIDSNEQAIRMYETGDLDILKLNSADAIKYQQSGDIQYAFDGSVWYLQLNVHGKANDVTQGTGKFLNNPNFRKAIAFAIDRKQLVDTHTNGVSLPSLRFVHPELMGNENYYSVERPLSFYSQNAQVELARQCLEAALDEIGVTEVPAIELLIIDSQIMNDQAITLKNMLWENLGIELVIKRVDFNTRNQLMSAGEYDIVFAGWAPDYNDPMTYLDMWAEVGGLNNTNWNSVQYKSLIDLCKTTSDMSLRLDKMLEAESYLLENGPVIPIYFRKTAYIQNPNLEGMVKNFIGPELDFIYSNVIE